MGTHKSRHNKGRKPFYKEHRLVAAHMLERPAYPNRGWYSTRTWWQPAGTFKLNILCEADSDVEQSADALGRQPSTLVHKAREQGFIIPQQWARLVAPKRTAKPRAIKKPPLLSYPYIQAPSAANADLREVNALIPKGIPDHMRADMCQEIMLAIFEGRTSLEALGSRKGSAQYFIKKFYRDNYEDSGLAISFNDTDEDWNSDAVASSIAAKEWHREQFQREYGHTDTIRTFTPPTQFQAAWRDQVGRVHLKFHELGHFLSEEEVEELMEEYSEAAA